MKSLLVAVALASTAALSHAQPMYYVWSYTGYEASNSYDPERVWRDDMLMAGAFKGEDVDHDGTIRFDEISMFSIGADYFDFPGAYARTCTVYRCQLSQFSYTPGTGDILFAGGTLNYSNGSFYGSTDYQTIDKTAPAVHWSFDSPVEFDAYITPATTFSIISVVPEPSAAAMLLAGCAVGAGLLGRKHRRYGDLA